VVGPDVHDLSESATELSGPTALLDGLEATIREVIECSGEPDAIGVGVPSQVEFHSGTVVTSVNIPLEGVTLARDLEDRLGVRVYLDNDANCAALAEAQFTEGGPARHLLMLTLGTGVGGGLSAACDLFLPAAEEEAAARALPALFQRVQIAAARAGSEAGVIGAGLLAAQELGLSGDTSGPRPRQEVR
jgi:predicted NBD/HSP70 family sugar kinase